MYLLQYNIKPNQRHQRKYQRQPQNGLPITMDLSSEGEQEMTAFTKAILIMITKYTKFNISFNFLPFFNRHIIVYSISKRYKNILATLFFTINIHIFKTII